MSVEELNLKKKKKKELGKAERIRKGEKGKIRE